MQFGIGQNNTGRGSTSKSNKDNKSNNNEDKNTNILQVWEGDFPIYASAWSIRNGIDRFIVGSCYNQEENFVRIIKHEENESESSGGKMLRRQRSQRGGDNKKKISLELEGKNSIEHEIVKSSLW